MTNYAKMGMSLGENPMQKLERSTETEVELVRRIYDEISRGKTKPATFG